MALWKLEDLKSELNKNKSIKAWILSSRQTRRAERYFLRDGSNIAVDQDHESLVTTWELEVHVPLDEKGFHGEASTRLFPTLDLDSQIKEVVANALKTKFKEWTLAPLPQNNPPKPLAADPRIVEDFHGSMEQLTKEVIEAAKSKTKSRFDSAELFLIHHKMDTWMSQGFESHTQRTQVYAEAAYSMEATSPSGQHESNEFMDKKYSVSLDQIKIKELFGHIAELAEKSVQTQKTQTGMYSVLIDADSFVKIIESQLSLANAKNKYLNLPFKEPNSHFVGESSNLHQEGDALNITLDPTVPLGASTTAFSMAVPQSKTVVVKDNKVAVTQCDQRHSCYLGIPTTTTVGNFVVGLGKQSKDDLLKSESKVFEILQFSSLNVDNISGTFSSEIRLAKVHNLKDKSVTYVKGGSLSGSVTQNFTKLKLSAEEAHLAHFDYGSIVGQGYQGPAYALLNDVSIVGL